MLMRESFFFKTVISFSLVTDCNFTNSFSPSNSNQHAGLNPMGFTVNTLGDQIAAFKEGERLLWSLHVMIGFRIENVLWAKVSRNVLTSTIREHFSLSGLLLVLSGLNDRQRLYLVEIQTLVCMQHFYGHLDVQQSISLSMKRKCSSFLV